MFQYVITKMDPTYKNIQNKNGFNNWTSILDIGKSFNGKVLTEDEYLKVELNFILCIKAIASSEISSAKIKNLKIYDHNIKWVNNSFINISKILDLSKDCLRKKCCCKIEAKNFFIHFGPDFYIYVGCSKQEQAMKMLCKNFNLLVEKKESPYMFKNVIYFPNEKIKEIGNYINKLIEKNKLLFKCEFRTKESKAWLIIKNPSFKDRDIKIFFHDNEDEDIIIVWSHTHIHVLENIIDVSHLIYNPHALAKVIFNFLDKILNDKIVAFLCTTKDGIKTICGSYEVEKNLKEINDLKAESDILSIVSWTGTLDYNTFC